MRRIDCGCTACTSRDQSYAELLWAAKPKAPWAKAEPIVRHVLPAPPMRETSPQRLHRMAYGNTLPVVEKWLKGKP